MITIRVFSLSSEYSCVFLIFWGLSLNLVKWQLMCLALLGCMVSAASADEATSGAATPVGPQGATAGAPSQSTNTNEAVAQKWSQTNAGAAAPALVQQQDGTTNIEWHGGLTADNYTNDVDTHNTFGSALRKGNQSLLRLQSDLRATAAEGDVNYFQLGLSATDDRAVLSQYSRQINTVQVGRAGAGYIVSMGDVAPNFSSLSSALGVRGLSGQRQIGRANISMYAGVVVPSWEYLEQNVPRTQMMKEVQGAKIEYAFTDQFKAYVTGQHGEDKADSVHALYTNATRISAGSVGFQFFDTSVSLSGETALSHFQQDDGPSRNGSATIVDGAWSGSNVVLRGGYHDLNAKYLSLSQAARPGTREAYATADWVMASWISLGADVRKSKSFTLATFFFPSQMMDTDSGSVRARINFGANYPNWNLALQESIANSRDSFGHASSQEQGTLNLNYAANQWNASFGYGLGRQENEANPIMDGDTNTFLASVGRLFSNQNTLSAATWMINTNLSTSLQDQSLNSGLDTKAFLTSLNISGQRTGWGMLNLMLGSGFNTRPYGQSALHMTTVQIDGSQQIGTRGSIKVYARDIRRNMHDALLSAEERVTGVQLSYVF